MTFDLTEPQQEWSRRARDYALAVLSPIAQAIDDRGVIPNDVRDGLSSRALTNPFADSAIVASVVIEEIAAVSAGAATAIGLEWTGAATGATGRDGWPGLRGSAPVADPGSSRESSRARLVLCAVALGVGRAAIAIAVEAMKSRGLRPGGDETTPHWTLADAAAELDGARLLTLSAAQIVEGSERADTALSMAARLSATAAERAVEAATLVVGVDGYRPGSPLERFTRDARTLKLLLEEGTRHKA